MYLHPVIHTELARQKQDEISRRALRASLIADRDEKPLERKLSLPRLRRVIAALATPALR